MCMAMRGIRKQGSTTVTSSFKGEYETDKNEQLKFMTLINS
jgi:GTP cyclohydrolase I